MPQKRHTRKNKKQQKGKKQKNTTFKKGGSSKTLAEIVKEKLEANDYRLVQQLIDYPDRKYAILIDFCKDNKLVVNTEAFLSHSFLPPDEGYETYNHNLTIPEDFEKGKALEIVIFANKDGIQYNTVVKDNKFQPQNCKPERLPVIYRVPEITTPDIEASRAEMSSVTDEQSGEEEELMDDIFRDSLPYDELIPQDDVTEQASINMDDLQEGDLEDVTDIAQSSAIKPNDVSKEIKATIKDKELEGVSEKPELKNFKDELNLLKKKMQKPALRSREEGDIDTISPNIDLKELAREQKEAKKKQQEEIDRLAHEARMKAEEEAKKKQAEEEAKKKQAEEDIDDDEEWAFEEISDDEAEKEQKEENERTQLFNKYITEIQIISGILQSMMMAGKVSSDKTHRDDYTPALRQLKTKYEALIDIFNKDNTQNIPKKTKKKIIDVLTNNHRRLQALRNYDRAGIIPKLKFESNFMDKVQDSLSIMSTLNTYFQTLDESLMKNFGNKPHVSYDYTKYVDGGKKTRKNRRKTKQRKTKKRV